MKKIFEARELPDNQNIYFKKDFLGWRIVYPVLKNPNEKFSPRNINWMNLLFGGKRNFVYLILFMVFLALLYRGLYDATKDWREIGEHPCFYCRIQQKDICGYSYNSSYNIDEIQKGTELFMKEIGKYEISR